MTQMTKARFRVKKKKNVKNLPEDTAHISGMRGEVAILPDAVQDISTPNDVGRFLKIVLGRTLYQGIRVHMRAADLDVGTIEIRYFHSKLPESEVRRVCDECLSIIRNERHRQ